MKEIHELAFKALELDKLCTLGQHVYEATHSDINDVTYLDKYKNLLIKKGVYVWVSSYHNDTGIIHLGTFDGKLDFGNFSSNHYLVAYKSAIKAALEYLIKQQRNETR